MTMLPLLLTLLIPTLDLDRIEVKGTGFVHASSKQPFIPWGFNYDHDETGRLLEDYWEKEWPKVEADFREMKELGANTVRIHLQVGRFLDSATEANPKSLEQLSKLLKLAEATGLYLDLTGLGCYHKPDVPPWYDALDDEGRWRAQVVFWKAVANTCKQSPAVFCYDLMNEPVVSGTDRKKGEWLGGAFAGKYFVQFINLSKPSGARPEVARRWIETLAKAVREVDRSHLITVGMVDWSLDRPGLSSGFVPKLVAEPLDFLCVHLYPEKKKVPEAIATLKGFAELGKPVVIEETFPLKSGMDDFKAFFHESKPIAAGWVGFYWGKTLAELREGKKKSISDAIVAGWLEFFQAEKAFMTAQR